MTYSGATALDESWKPFTVTDGVYEPKELDDCIKALEAKEEADRLAKEAQEAKQLALDTITVEVNGKVFDGRDKDQTRMMAAIQASELLGIPTDEWKLHNDEVVEVTVDELKQALALSIQEVGRIVKEL